MTTSYSNLGGSGWRNNVVIATSSALFMIGSAPNLIDGNTGGGNWFINGACAGHYIKFEFPESVIIDEAKYYQSDSSNQGTWKWQGSNNDSDWTDIGDSFVLGGASPQTQTTLNGNTTAYKFYQLLGVSGSVNFNPWVSEFEFKIAGSGAAETYYRNIGSGDRTYLITVTSDVISGTVSTLVNGGIE